MAIEEFDVILKDEGQWIDVIFQSEKAKEVVKKDKLLNEIISDENNRVWLPITNDHASGKSMRDYCDANDLIVVEF